MRISVMKLWKVWIDKPLGYAIETMKEYKMPETCQHAKFFSGKLAHYSVELCLSSDLRVITLHNVPKGCSTSAPR